MLTSVSYALTPDRRSRSLSTTNSAGTGAINLTGNEFAQTITGNAGANVIDGGGGADIMQAALAATTPTIVDNVGDKS